MLDIIFKNDQPISAVPGGSVFNGLISLGRAGVQTSLISETGNDRVGRRIVSFLEENGVADYNDLMDAAENEVFNYSFLEGTESLGAYRL